MSYRYIKTCCFLSLLIITATLAGCKKSNQTFAEPVKNIEGTWTLDKVIRNDEDITSRVDVSEFKLVFEADATSAGGSGNYSIANGAPFVVSRDGAWRLDDPEYPFHLQLTPGQGTDPVSIKFAFPAIQGENEIKLTFSPGCSSNTYQYYLKKAPK